MITYCTGSAREKRRYFKEVTGAVVLDNVEVLFCAGENGKNYFALGDAPFGSFTVDEYINFRRALCEKSYSPEVLKRFKISPIRRIRSLSTAEMRCVQFLEKTAGLSDKPIVVNLDGTRYSRRNNAALMRLLAENNEAYVCVSDARFLKHAPVGIQTLAFGFGDGKRPKFYAAKRLAKAIGAKKVAVM